MVQEKREKQIRLHVPADVYKFLLEEQGKIKKDCSCQFSLASTIIKLLREMKNEI